MHSGLHKALKDMAGRGLYFSQEWISHQVRKDKKQEQKDQNAEQIKKLASKLPCNGVTEKSMNFGLRFFAVLYFIGMLAIVL